MFMRFQAPNIFRVQRIDRIPVLAAHPSVCARRHPQFSPRVGHRPRPLKVKIEGPWMQSDSLL